MENENRVASSSQFPVVYMSVIELHMTIRQHTPVIIGTLDTWPRSTEYWGGSVRKTPSTRGNQGRISP